MTKAWGQYTLTVTEIATGKVVFRTEYQNMSGHAMMDEQRHYRLMYNAKEYRIDW